MVFSLPNMEPNIWHRNFAKMLLCDDGESGPDTKKRFLPQMVKKC